MSHTLAEQILAVKSGQPELRPGQLIDANVDMALGNDITTPIAIKGMRGYVDSEGKSVKVWDPRKVVLVMDHFTPNKDIKSAEQVKFIREFAKEQGIDKFFDVGCMGIEHILLPEQGIVMPYDLVIGADSHTCTYGALGAFATGVGSTDLAGVLMTGKIWMKVPEARKFVLKGEFGKYVGGKDLILRIIGDIGVAGATYMSMEFTGKGAESMSMSDRMTVSNMAIEAGGKAGLFEVDAKTIRYVKTTVGKPHSRYSQFSDAQFSAGSNEAYAHVDEYDLGELELQVAKPHLPENSEPISKVQEEEIPVDQSVIGACTNGKIEDLRMAAEVLKGHKVHKYVRLIVIPGTIEIYRQAMREGLVDVFHDAGGIVSTPTCGPCLGGHMGVLAKGERAIATTNRNFVGRMGSPESEVYLSGPAVAAASAVKGHICGPEVLQ